MKGLWNNEKSGALTFRPALDALNAVNADTLLQALSAALGNGCAFIISATRDQGALCLTLLDGNDRHKIYVSTVAELDKALQDLVDSFESAKSTAAQKASKR